MAVQEFPTPCEISFIMECSLPSVTEEACDLLIQYFLQKHTIIVSLHISYFLIYTQYTTTNLLCDTVV